MPEENIPGDGPGREQVLSQLDAICGNHQMATSPILVPLFRFLVQAALDDPSAPLTEFAIGRSFFKKPSNWSPKKDSVVRTNANHLRKRLRTYYELDGYNDPIEIKINRGGYLPVFSFRTPSPPELLEFLNDEALKLIPVVKIALDQRTFKGDLYAIKYAGDAVLSNKKFIQSVLASESSSAMHPRIASIYIFAFFVAFREPAIAIWEFEDRERVLRIFTEAGFRIWELTFSLACLNACKYHNWSEAMILFRRAERESANESWEFWWHTAFLASQGFLSEATSIVEGMVSRLAKSNVGIRCDLAMLQIMGKRRRDAEETLSTTRDLVSADHIGVAAHAAILFESMDDLVNASRATTSTLERYFATLPENARGLTADQCKHDPLIFGLHALILGRLGDPEALEWIDLFIEKRKIGRNVYSAVLLAMAFIGTRQYIQAVQWLQVAAFQEFDPYVIWFGIFPPLRHLKDLPEFKQLLIDLRLEARF